MNERVKVPAVIDLGPDGIAPTHEELGQEDRDKQQVVENEAFVNGVIGGLEGRQVCLQQTLYGDEAVHGIPDNERQVQDQQAEHQEVDDEPDELVTGLQFLAIDVQHAVTVQSVVCW